MTSQYLRAHQKVNDLIEAQLKRDDLSPDEILQITIARRLNNCSEQAFVQALGAAKPPLNFWNRR